MDEGWTTDPLLVSLAAALQFVRKACPERSRRVSGYRAPSRANEAAFDQAVEEISSASRRWREGLARR